MGMRQFLAFSLSKILSQSKSGLTISDIFPYDMLSTPAPIPILWRPLMIDSAICMQAWSPDEHWRFTAMQPAVSGIPAMNYAILALTWPAAGWRALPTATSSTSLGSALARSMTAFKAAWSICSGGVFLKPPLLPRAIGVRAYEQMTTSSSDFVAIVPASWVKIWHTVGGRGLGRKELSAELGESLHVEFIIISRESQRGEVY